MVLGEVRGGEAAKGLRLPDVERNARLAAPSGDLLEGDYLAAARWANFEEDIHKLAAEVDGWQVQLHPLLALFLVRLEPLLSGLAVLALTGLGRQPGPVPNVKDKLVGAAI